LEIYSSRIPINPGCLLSVEAITKDEIFAFVNNLFIGLSINDSLRQEGFFLCFIVNDGPVDRKKVE